MTLCKVREFLKTFPHPLGLTDDPSKLHTLNFARAAKGAEDLFMRYVNCIGTPLERFFSKVVISTTCSHGGTPCWEWTGFKTKLGYSKFWPGGSKPATKMVAAHIWSYRQFVGEIPQGLDIDHLCRNRQCVNPNHLEPVTEIENIMRGISPHAINAMKVFCKRGHRLCGDNIRRTKDGNRECRICDKIRRENHKS